jgi:signal transduction histidine kinase
MNHPSAHTPEAEVSYASVLIVDDDPKNLLAMEALLEGMGHKVVLANSGEDALRRVLEHDFAVILLDARMPGLDGFTTAKLIRERDRSRHTPIIFLTGAYEDARSMFRGYEAGAVDYIVKPPIPEVLKSKIAVFADLHNKNVVLQREIGERKKAEESLRASQESLRALTARLQSIREEEGTRISREIHDELGQSLTGLKMDLTWLSRRLTDNKALEPKIKSMFGLIDDTIRSVRRIASRLRPEALDQLGLVAAIGWQARDFQMRTGIRCKVTLPAEALNVDQETSTGVFRIFQELLTNVARHANATKVDVCMEVAPDALLLTVQDNGRGIAQQDASSGKSLGLMGMRERALLLGGDIRIEGSRAKGTRADVRIPLANRVAPASGPGIESGSMPELETARPGSATPAGPSS